MVKTGSFYLRITNPTFTTIFIVTTQDPVLGCWLSFAEAIISDCCTSCASRRNPRRTGLRVRQRFVHFWAIRFTALVIHSVVRNWCNHLKKSYNGTQPDLQIWYLDFVIVVVVVLQIGK
jgi:hypothetical protein